MAEDIHSKVNSPRVAFTDVIVDVLGSLVPGAVFLIGLWIGLINPAGQILANLAGTEASNGLDFSEVLLGKAQFDIGSTAVLISLGIALSFVVGTVFFRLYPES